MKVLKSWLLLGALALTACQNAPAGGTVAQAQNFAIAACGYLPTAETILAILAKKSSQLDNAEAIAAAICAAVRPKIATFVARAPAVLGVPIKGKFVK